jgi:5-methylcytosine-specific restriction enzyme B
MKGTIEERRAIWNEFLQRWPLDKLDQMTLAEYAQAGDKDSFVNWLEGRTESLGSIWGGSAFKFGVYSRKDRTPKPDGVGVRYTQDYAWAAKYGDNPEAAFEAVRAIVVQVATAARASDLATIDAADLGTVTKWKIAFLYQNPKHPCVVPILTKENLQLIAGPDTPQNCGAMHTQLMAQAHGTELLTYGDQLWEKIQAIDAAKLSTSDAHAFLVALDYLSAIKEPTDRMAGFRAADGREIALARDNKAPTLYLRQGGWLTDAVRESLESVTAYADDRSRSNSLQANAPSLAKGNAIVKVVVPTRSALAALCDAYFDDETNVAVNDPTPAVGEPMTRPPLNQILFGPPGTGKTYAAVNAALEILDPDLIASLRVDPAPKPEDEQRKLLKARFDALVKDQRIRFVTFHQSFSYEDFVEGLRADTDATTGQLRYAVADGVFKTLCEVAAAKVTRRTEGAVDVKGRRIWKMSLGNTLGPDAAIFDECMAEGRALLGWGGAIDFDGCKNRADVVARFQQAGLAVQDPNNDYAVTSVTTFVTRMKKGDLLVISDGNFKFRAIGEISGDYQFRKHPGYDDDFSQSRPVRWLRQYQPSLPLGELMNNQFSQMTLYELRPGSIDVEKLQTLLGAEIGSSTGSSTGDARVLIIDEINRGNVSRIFGELITLIEPTKRAGADEALQVVLPYSKHPFSVPDNVYLIGTMNTADRSLAGLDVALRRRFAFKEMLPRPELLDRVSVCGVNIAQLLTVMNHRIEALLDREHCIGHAYFMPLQSDPSIERLSDIFRNQVLPLLQEYFFDDWQRIQWVLNDHRKSDQAHRFIHGEPLDTTALFGNDVNVSRRSQTWKINGDAFLLAQSYLGVLGN